MIETIAEHGVAVKVSGLMEWIYYTDWCVRQRFPGEKIELGKQLSIFLRAHFMRKHEKIIKKIFAGTGLYAYKLEDIQSVIDPVRHLINPQLTGEAVLTVGSSLTEILKHYCGVIAIGPFGCMPNRVAEAVLSMEMNREGKVATGIKGAEQMEQFKEIEELPFLAIESDGNPFPQIITAKMEAFMLQARRVHRAMMEVKHGC